MQQFIAYSAWRHNVRRREFQVAALLFAVLTAADYITSALAFHSGGVEAGSVATGLGEFSLMMAAVRVGVPIVVLGAVAVCRDWALGRAMLWLPVLMFAAVDVSNIFVATGRSGLFG